MRSLHHLIVLLDDVRNELASHWIFVAHVLRRLLDARDGTIFGIIGFESLEINLNLVSLARLLLDDQSILLLQQRQHSAFGF